MLALPREGVEGAFAEMLSHLEAALNFTARTMQRKDEVWGSKVILDDGMVKWTGMVGSLHKGEGDLISAPLTNTQHRYGN